ncbi:hypothetical protein GDO81_021635 [Engystomops pustulosus]|uniref:Uncharacterized protein n=1 Tax=Engystomops pustulosus TaxID=76066 RepID=A0AAV6Z5Z1_ENGPU|nr:hypothetical protein GDO81_021635 [Engystomops pustulosus]
MDIVEDEFPPLRRLLHWISRDFLYMKLNVLNDFTQELKELLVFSASFTVIFLGIILKCKDFSSSHVPEYSLFFRQRSGCLMCQDDDWEHSWNRKRQVRGASA